jgi:hypothetical protein
VSLYVAVSNAKRNVRRDHYLPRLCTGVLLSTISILCTANRVREAIVSHAFANLLRPKIETATTGRAVVIETRHSRCGVDRESVERRVSTLNTPHGNLFKWVATVLVERHPGSIEEILVRNLTRVDLCIRDAFGREIASSTVGAVNL